MLTSTKAGLNSYTILTYITPAKLISGGWNGSSESFILYWQTQVSGYEKWVTEIEKLSNKIKQPMLEMSLTNCMHSEASKQWESNHMWWTFSIIYRAAQRYDTQFSRINYKGQKHTVYQH